MNELRPLPLIRLEHIAHGKLIQCRSIKEMISWGGDVLKMQELQQKGNAEFHIKTGNQLTRNETDFENVGMNLPHQFNCPHN